MPDFAYTARNFEGQKVTGTLFAQSEREAVANLSSQQLFPLAIAQQKTASQKSAFNRRVSGQTMAVTYSQLASLLRSGVPLLRSIGVIRDQTSHVVLKEVLDDVYRRVEDGTPFGEAIARYPRVFSELAINMVKAGGDSRHQRLFDLSRLVDAAARWPHRAALVVLPRGGRAALARAAVLH